VCCNIADGPENVRIINGTSVSGSSTLNTLKDGDRLTCVAEANPVPVYHWTDVSSGGLIHRGLANTRAKENLGF